jgi:hypothetical protein
MATDEWVRGLIMWWRWRSGAWKSLALVRPIDGALDAAPVEVAEGL